MAILNKACTKTVHGQTRMDAYLEILNIKKAVCKSLRQ